MRLAAVLVFIAALVLGCDGRAEDSTSFPIRDGDHVVIWGDSISDRQPWPKTIEHYILTTHPDWRVKFTNLSWGGDRADNIDRMKRDYPLAEKPTLTIFVLGMNDGRYTQWTEEIQQTHETGMRQLITYAQENGSRVLLLTPPRYEADKYPIDPYGKRDLRDYPSSLRKLSDGAIRIAEELGAEYIDINKLYTENEAIWKKIDRELDVSYDGIHPDAEGYALFAYSVLQGMGADFKLGETVVDWSEGTVTYNGNASTPKVTTVAGRKALTWQRESARLPFIYANWMKPHLHHEILEIISPKDNLKVNGFDSPFGVVMADGRPIGVWSDEALKSGVNLAMHPEWAPGGPQSQFALDQLNTLHKLHWERWRELLAPYSNHPFDHQPLLNETRETDLLTNQVEFYREQAWKWNLAKPITMELVPVDTSTPFGSAPFELEHPLPAFDQVQVLFTVDTNVLNSLYISDEFPSETIIPPIEVRGNFDAGNESRLKPGFLPVELNDMGLNGDAKASDGVWSLKANIRKSDHPVTFFFTDKGRPENLVESPICARLRTWKDTFVPNSNIHINFDETELDQLVEKGVFRR